MSIDFDSKKQLFTLRTRNSMYQMQVSEPGYLLHLYYGAPAEGNFDYLYLPWDCGFSPNPYECSDNRGWSLDTLPQEYSGSNGGDFRLRSLDLTAEGGAKGADLRYLKHEIRRGKYELCGLPCARGTEDAVETLSITLRDDATGVEAELLYGVYEESDVITRAARIHNRGAGRVKLEKAASVCLDLRYGDWDLIHFHGRHVMERQVERTSIMHGIHTVGSLRGFSSHQHNPFVILCDHDAGEDTGDCYGVMLAYSGSYGIEVERDQVGSVRSVAGIRDEQFSWTLAPGESLDTPEAFLVYSREGLTELSHRYHRFLRTHVMRSRYAMTPRPVLINNWEATYFDFNTEKLVRIAEEAKSLGVELFVLDDGWFGSRIDDHRGLGDWFVNEEKLPGGLLPLIEKIHALGMKFGIWIEPEMVNEDSDLYRAHPDWALQVPGRRPTLGRSQMVLDLCRDEVVEYLYAVLSDLLRKHPISYIKWDANRNLTDLHSPSLPPERQGEAAHRYVLGLYRLMERLTSDFPEVLFEGCCGGGGRFDAGILTYSPQIWCSDDTDAIERLEIQRGTSFGYPISAMGAHVSACPNHQTGRSTPLGTRAVVAMSGTFGYELDPGKLTEEEKAEIRTQIARFHEYYHLIQNGDYYRLSDPERTAEQALWQFVSPDLSETLVNLVCTHIRGNSGPIHFRLKGLDPAARYALERNESFGNLLPPDASKLGGGEERGVYSGAALMYGGFTLPPMYGDFPSVQLYFKRV